MHDIHHLLGYCFHTVLKGIMCTLCSQLGKGTKGMNITITVIGNKQETTFTVEWKI